MDFPLMVEYRLGEETSDGNISNDDLRALKFLQESCMLKDMIFQIPHYIRCSKTQRCWRSW